MTTSRSRDASALWMAMICSGVVIAQFVGGKATRDALFLARVSLAALPNMIVAASIFSIALVTLTSKAMTRLTPAVFVPAAFLGNAALLLVAWALLSDFPRVAAVVVYLQIVGLGPVLVSGFWSVVTERLDPRTAKRRIGRIAAAGTLGGLAGGLLAERVAAVMAAPAMLPILAALSLFSAWGVHRLAPVNLAAARRAARTQDSAPKAASGLRVVARVPYLRNLAALALIAALGAAMVDYLLKVGAVRSLGRGENLLRFFAIYYAATSLLTFVMQTSFSRVALEKLGLGLTTASHSLALLAGSAMALLAPGFGSVITARAGETVFRGSFFRSGYELFYTPIPAAEKRPAKSIIDVGFDRLGDAAGGGIVRLVLVVAPAAQYSIILMVAMACSVGAIALARRLNRGYIQSLEKSLLNRALELDLSDVEDRTTRTIMVRTLNRPATALRRVDSRVPADAPVADPVMVSDPEVQQIIDLRSGDRERILRVLDQDEGIAPAVVPHAVRLLAWDPVAEDAIFALKKVAEEHIGLLTDSLIDPNQDFAVRRRLAQVFSVCVSQRAADGLMLGLEDLRFEVRFRCGRSLAALLEKNPRIRIDASLVSEIVLREVNVGRPVWESHRLLDGLDDGVRVSFVDEFLRDRTNQSLAHVFTLLSLILPRAPLLIAYRGLHTTDQHLRGTALEYLESVLPAAVRTRLWPFLEDSRSPARSTRTRTEILDELLQSNQSIILNLEEMKRHVKRVAAAGPSTTARS